MLRHKFEKGNKAALGNKGGGRPTDWLKEKCQAIIKDRKLVEFLGDVATGPNYETDIKLKAIAMLLDRGFGKALQEVRPVDNEGNYAPFQIFMPAQVSGQEGKAS